MSASGSTENGSTARIRPTHDDAPRCMLGDVNLFLKYADDDDDTESERPRTIVGEIELMVAEKINQGCGFGRASVVCFLRYIIAHEGDILREFRSRQEGHQSGKGEGEKFTYFVVRIGATNERSLALFESIGFKRATDEPNYFGELELRMYGVKESTMIELMERYGTKGYEEDLYDLSAL